MGKFPSLVRFLKSPNYPGATISPAVNVDIKYNGTVSILAEVAYYFNIPVSPTSIEVKVENSGALPVASSLFCFLDFSFNIAGIVVYQLICRLIEKTNRELKFGGMFFT